MSQRHPLALVGGAATLLAALPLSTVFESYAWLVFSAIAVALVVGTAMGVRSMHGSLPAQVLAMAAALLLLLTWKFPSGEEFARLIPTGATFRHFGQLLADSSTRIRGESVPLPDFDGVLLLTIAGVGLAAITVDVLAVGLRRPAVAGLPMLAIYSVPVAVLPDGLSVLPFGFAAAGYLWLLVSDSVDRMRRFGRRFTGDGRDVEGVGALAARLGRPPAGPGGRHRDRDHVAVGCAGHRLRTDRPFGAGVVTRGDGGPIGGGAAGIDRGHAGRDSTGRLTQRKTYPHGGGWATDRYVPRTTCGSGSPTRWPTDYFTYEGAHGRCARGRRADRDRASAAPRRDGPAPPGSDRGVNLDMEPRPDLPGADRDRRSGRRLVLWTRRASRSFSRGARRQRPHLQPRLRAAVLHAGGAALGRSDRSGPTSGLRRRSTVPPVQQVTVTGRPTHRGRAQPVRPGPRDDDHFPRQGLHHTTVGGAGYQRPRHRGLSRRPSGGSASSTPWPWPGSSGRPVIPARVAVGFTRGAGADSGVTTLTNRNLHAWTEVFFPGFGWVPFDPTPAGTVVGSAPVAWESQRSDGPGGQGEQTRPTPPVDTGRPGGPTGPQPAPPADGGFPWREFGESQPVVVRRHRVRRTDVGRAAGPGREPSVAAAGPAGRWHRGRAAGSRAYQRAGRLGRAARHDGRFRRAGRRGRDAARHRTRLGRLSDLDRVGDELTLLATAEEAAGTPARHCVRTGSVSRSWPSGGPWWSGRPDGSGWWHGCFRDR